MHFELCASHTQEGAGVCRSCMQYVYDDDNADNDDDDDDNDDNDNDDNIW